MNVVYAGTPEFAARALDALLRSRHRVSAVLTRPDRPAGRGLAPASSPVKRLALERGLPVLQPESLKTPEAQAQVRSLEPDVALVAAYGLILPQAVLDIPRLGAVNIHASLLPRWRGAAPIQRALLAGDRETGISIMRMDAGLDTGPVLLQEPLRIGDDDTAGTLHDRLAELGAAMAVRALDALETGQLQPRPQQNESATYAPKIEKKEALIDWHQDATSVRRQVRAFDPVPGARSRIRGMEIKLWSCVEAAERGPPGEIVSVSEQGVAVACARGAVRLTELQRSGGKRLGVAEFLRGFPLAAGERFEAAPTGKL
ncbi:MAG: methionyl-tRNA formyltransferase [Betaproteobacteria bacterium]|nr:methionyl-tRNA formyltransferase [Betaproteobacteria bacterium]